MGKALAKTPPAELVALTLQAQQVLDYLQAGYRIPAIAKILGIDREAVRRAILEIDRRDFEHGLLKREHLRAQAAVDLDYIQHELEEAWEESKPEKDISIEKQIQEIVDGNALPSQVKRVTIKHNYEHGDARYLQLAKDTLQAKIKLLGLNAPNKPAIPQLPDMNNLPEGTSAVVRLREAMITIRKNILAAESIPGKLEAKSVEAGFQQQLGPESEGAAA